MESSERIGIGGKEDGGFGREDGLKDLEGAGRDWTWWDWRRGRWIGWRDSKRNRKENGLE